MTTLLITLGCLWLVMQLMSMERLQEENGRKIEETNKLLRRQHIISAQCDIMDELYAYLKKKVAGDAEIFRDRKRLEDDGTVSYEIVVEYPDSRPISIKYNYEKDRKCEIVSNGVLDRTVSPRTMYMVRECVEALRG